MWPRRIGCRGCISLLVDLLWVWNNGCRQLSQGVEVIFFHFQIQDHGLWCSGIGDETRVQEIQHFVADFIQLDLNRLPVLLGYGLLPFGAIDPLLDAGHYVPWRLVYSHHVQWRSQWTSDQKQIWSVLLVEGFLEGFKTFTMSYPDVVLPQSLIFITSSHVIMDQDQHWGWYSCLSSKIDVRCKHRYRSHRWAHWKKALSVHLQSIYTKKNMHAHTHTPKPALDVGQQRITDVSWQWKVSMSKSCGVKFGLYFPHFAECH